MANSPSPDFTTCQGCKLKHYQGSADRYHDVPAQYRSGLYGQVCELCLGVLRDAGYNATILSNLGTFLGTLMVPSKRPNK